MKRNLGKSNIKVSSIGLGCFPIGGLFYHKGEPWSHGPVDEKDAIKAIQKGLELGINLFDTSDVYGCGRSELILGKAIKDRRDEVVIATKFSSVWDMNSGDPKVPCQSTGEKNIIPEYIKNCCLESLERLQTDYIDIYQLHWSSMNLEKAAGVRDVLEELVDEGLIRTFGWSTDSIERAKVFANSKNCSSMQFSLNFTRSNNQMLELLDEFKLGGLIRSPLGMGVLIGKYNTKSHASKDHYLQRANFSDEIYVQTFKAVNAIKELMTNDGRSLAQAALGYILAKHERIVPIPGFKNVTQVEDNAKAMDLGPLSNKLVSKIDEIFSELRMDMSKAY
ncbi:MAG: aldo/keto reductase [Candidatus Heimdallarchaeota archaeon]|nr:aldo/keto reductase [Candidatus Heimdallarchaeota archaeon]